MIVPPGATCRPIRLADERSQRRIDVRRSLEPKMMAEAKRTKILDASQERMFGAAPQPKTSVKVRGANNGACKTHPRLNDNPTLLRVRVHRPAFTGGRQPAVPRLLTLARLVAKVFAQRHADARVPKVLGDEPMPALGTFPKRPMCWHARPRSDLGQRISAGRLNS